MDHDAGRGEPAPLDQDHHRPRAPGLSRALPEFDIPCKRAGLCADVACFQPLDWSVASKSVDWQRATVIADERFATKTYDEW